MALRRRCPARLCSLFQQMLSKWLQYQAESPRSKQRCRHTPNLILLPGPNLSVTQRHDDRTLLAWWRATAWLARSCRVKGDTSPCTADLC